MQVNSMLLVDGYKCGHVHQYPADTQYVYSNLTARGSRVPGVEAVVFFGLQYFCLRYLIDHFDEHFFSESRQNVLAAYERRMQHYLGPMRIDHIANLHDRGYLPIRIKALPEGTVVPLRVPMLTIVNTEPEFYWLTNALETLKSSVMWKAITSATTAHQYRSTFDRFARLTGGDLAFCPFQGHDFSFRGLSGPDDAVLSGAAHLLSFVGTDTVPAIDFLEQYYGADAQQELVGCSVPATEHSVMSMGTPEREEETFRRLLTEVYPKGILSVVSDTWDLWHVIDHILPRLKDVIMARDGKLVIRPDSGDPVKIICGDSWKKLDDSPSAGAMWRLWELFGGTVNEAGYKVLDPHIGLIYGDSISRARQDAILDGLKDMGFCSSNIVLGIGSYTYQHVTRDTYGLAIKSTWGQTARGPQSIFKAPKTDDGEKFSAKGLLQVVRQDGQLVCREDVSPEEERQGLLETVFEDGDLRRRENLATIRDRLAEVRG